LYEIARDKDIPDKSEMNKAQLVNALHKADGDGGQSHQSKPGHGGGQGDTPPPKGADPDQYKNIPGNQT
jgi:hypothetical protein